MISLEPVGDGKRPGEPGAALQVRVIGQGKVAENLSEVRPGEGRVFDGVGVLEVKRLLSGAVAGRSARQISLSGAGNGEVMAVARGVGKSIPGGFSQPPIPRQAGREEERV